MKKNENEQTEKKSSSKVIVVIITLALIAVIVSISMYAYAKYVAEIKGQATAKIATWTFKVTDGEYNESIDIDLADTLSKANSKIEEGYVAPGTEGAFNLIADATGSEVSLVYNIDIDVSGVPENLKFYTDSNKTKKVIVTDGKIRIEDFLELKDSNQANQQIKTVYWKWEYQTGMSEYEKALEDEKDSAWMGKAIQMRVAITGKQVAKKPEYLADKVEIGSYVGYDASTGRSFTSEDCLAGISISDTFNSSDTMNWRVLYIDELTKTVELMAENPVNQTVTITGKNGYKNAIEVLNNIGSIYGFGKGSIGGRSINKDDVVQYANFDKYSYRNSANHSVGYEKEYDKGVFIMEDGKEIEANSNNKVKMMQTYYAIFNDENPNAFSNEMKAMLLYPSYTKPYWLATEVVDITSLCCFSISRVHGLNVGSPTNIYMTGDYNSENSNTHYAMPVVTLKSNIKAKAQIDNVWQLDI